MGIVKETTFAKFLNTEFRTFEKFISFNFERQLITAFYEVCRNIFDHSGQNIGSFSFHFRTQRDGRAIPYTQNLSKDNSYLVLAISDLGIGIKDSLVKNTDIEQEEKDIFYLKESIKSGVTSTGIPGRGNGLAYLTETVEKVQISSGKGKIFIEDGKVTREELNSEQIIGTSIYFKVDDP